MAFLGCGYAASLHSKTLAPFKEEVQCYYASRDPQKAEDFNRKFGGAGVFDSYDAASQSDAIDAVIVTTPPAMHLDLTLQALRDGKHVIVEKPPFLKASDFVAVHEAQRKAGRRVFVAENYFYKPLLARLRGAIESGVIGEIMFVHINALKMQRVNDWRGDPAVSGGGALFEGGIHWLSLISNLGLTVESVRGCRPGNGSGPDRSILVTLAFKEGAVGSFYYSWETPSLFKGLRISKIYGRKGSITFESNGIVIVIRGERKRIIFPGLRDIAGYKAMFRDFFSAIEEDRSPRYNLDLAKRDLELIEEIHASLNGS